jgi:hypothetical protein
MIWRWIENIFGKKLVSGIGFTKTELLLLKSILASENPNSEKLINQANAATNVSRWISSDGKYYAKIQFLTDSSFLIPFASHTDSPVFSVNINGKSLRFNTTIEKGGFLFGLKGCTSDGTPWPTDWEEKFEITQLICQGINDWIPKPIEKENESYILDALLDWVKVDAKEIPPKILETIKVNRPASFNEIEEAEAILGNNIGPLLKEFYLISNGITLALPRFYDIFGLSDLRIDQLVPGLKKDQVIPGAIITNLYEIGIVSVIAENGILGDDCFLVNPEGSKMWIGSIRDHIRDSILWVT